MTDAEKSNFTTVGFGRFDSLSSLPRAIDTDAPNAICSEPDGAISAHERLKWQNYVNTLKWPDAQKAWIENLLSRGSLLCGRRFTDWQTVPREKSRNQIHKKLFSLPVATFYELDNAVVLKKSSSSLPGLLSAATVAEFAALELAFLKTQVCLLDEPPQFSLHSLQNNEVLIQFEPSNLASTHSLLREAKLFPGSQLTSRSQNLSGSFVTTPVSEVAYAQAATSQSRSQRASIAFSIIARHAPQFSFLEPSLNETWFEQALANDIDFTAIRTKQRFIWPRLKAVTFVIEHSKPLDDSSSSLQKALLRSEIQFPKELF